MASIPTKPNDNNELQYPTVSQIANDPYLLNYFIASLPTLAEQKQFFEYLESSIDLHPCALVIPCAGLLYQLNEISLLGDILERHRHLFPSEPLFWLYQGYVYRSRNETHKALMSYRHAYTLDPSRYDTTYNLANSLSADLPLESIPFYHKAITLQPFSFQAWNNLTLAYISLHLYDCSLLSASVSLLLEPTSIDALCNYGISLLKLGRFRQAESSFHLATKLSPSDPSPYINLGVLHSSQNNLDKATYLLSQGITLDPDSTRAPFNLALCKLTLGSYSEGWRMYETRFYQSTPCAIFPLETGPTNGPRITSLDQLSDTNQTFVLWSEQGFGDTIQFSRYISLLLARGINIILVAQPELVPLFDHWFPEPISCLPSNSQQLSSTCLPHSPLLSLPLLFSTTLDTIPSYIPYLKTPNTNYSPIPIRQPAGCLSVGLCWGANPTNSLLYSSKSIKLDLLMPILLPMIDLGLLHLYPLQFSPDSEQLLPYIPHHSIFDLTSQVNSFSDTASIVSQLDMVITVDTALAHLSAALGIPTWILLSTPADFRWLLSRTDSPWYPNSVRLFRQHSMNDWSAVLQDLQSALNEIFLLRLQDLPLT